MVLCVNLHLTLTYSADSLACVRLLDMATDSDGMVRCELPFPSVNP